MYFPCNISNIYSLLGISSYYEITRTKSDQSNVPESHDRQSHLYSLGFGSYQFLQDSSSRMQRHFLKFKLICTPAWSKIIYMYLFQHIRMLYGIILVQKFSQNKADQGYYETLSYNLILHEGHTYSAKNIYVPQLMCPLLGGRGGGGGRIDQNYPEAKFLVILCTCI